MRLPKVTKCKIFFCLFLGRSEELIYDLPRNLYKFNLQEPAM
jgi:hypothetical protein